MKLFEAVGGVRRVLKVTLTLQKQANDSTSLARWAGTRDIIPSPVPH